MKILPRVGAQTFFHDTNFIKKPYFIAENSALVFIIFHCIQLEFKILNLLKVIFLTICTNPSPSGRQEGDEIICRTGKRILISYSSSSLPGLVWNTGHLSFFLFFWLQNKYHNILKKSKQCYD